MHIEAISNVNEARSESLLNKTVIAIDVLRATSTIVTALANGAKEILPVETIAEARELQREGTLLGGERLSRKIQGFDLGNSPLEYTRETVAGKTIILSTTNGTRAIQKAGKARHLLVGSFLNAGACAILAVQLKRDIALLCAGTQDVFALEDGLCAGLLTNAIRAAAAEPVTVDDLAAAMQAAYLQHRDSLATAIGACRNGVKLGQMGLTADLAHCLQADRYNLVPVLRRHALTPSDCSKILSGS